MAQFQFPRGVNTKRGIALPPPTTTSPLMTIPLKTAPLTRHSGTPAQKSHANPFDGRGRTGAARRRTHVSSDKADFLRRWSLLMIASFDSREACAVHFAVTFQTACNWFDALNAPYGQHVDFAQASLPNYARIMRGGA